MRLYEIISQSAVAQFSFAGPKSPILAQAVYEICHRPMIFICRKSDGHPLYAVNRISEDAFLDQHGVRSWLDITTDLNFAPDTIVVKEVTPVQIQDLRRKFHVPEISANTKQAAAREAERLISTYGIEQQTKPERPPPPSIPLGF